MPAIRAGGRTLLFRRIVLSYRAAFTGLPRDVWLLCAAALVNRAGTMVLPFIALFLTEERGLTVAGAGRLVGLYGVGSMAGSYLGGWLSDRIGTLRSQQLTLVGSAIGYLVFVRLRDPVEMAVGLLLLSLVADAFRPAVMAALAEHAPDEVKPRAFALLRLAANLGMAVGPSVGGVLALYSYVWLFVADAATCFLAAVMLTLFIRPARPDSRRAAAGESGATASPWRDRPFLLLVLWSAAYATVLFQVFTTLPLYLHEAYGLRENSIGVLIGFNAVLIVLFEMILTLWAERRDQLRLIGLGGFLTCAGLGLMPLGASIPFAALTIAVWTFGEMLTLPLLNALVAGRARPESRGSYMGVYMLAYSVAFIIAPPAGTWIFGRFGADTLWLGIGVSSPALWIAALAMRRLFPRPDDAAPTDTRPLAP